MNEFFNEGLVRVNQYNQYSQCLQSFSFSFLSQKKQSYIPFIIMAKLISHCYFHLHATVFILKWLSSLLLLLQCITHSHGPPVIVTEKKIQKQKNSDAKSGSKGRSNHTKTQSIWHPANRVWWKMRFTLGSLKTGSTEDFRRQTSSPVATISSTRSEGA